MPLIVILWVSSEPTQHKRWPVLPVSYPPASPSTLPSFVSQEGRLSPLEVLAGHRPNPVQELALGLDQWVDLSVPLEEREAGGDKTGARGWEGQGLHLTLGSALNEMLPAGSH